jgi:hypothetical protein
VADGNVDIHAQLIEELASFACRPYDFMYWAWPYGEAGNELQKRTPLEDWQAEATFYLQQKLLDGLATPEQIIAEAVQIAVKSGHDIGKSAWICKIAIWAISTREDTRGVITANTEKQLRLKLWPELRKWHRLFIASDLFVVTATSIQAKDPAREGEWRIDAIPWSEDNPEAFAGLHNYGKRIVVIYDEASGIPPVIWETTDGVFNEADTELIWIATGNPTRNTGRFRDCFNPEGQGVFWKTFTVDSRSVSFTNKDRIQKAIDLWGLESDYVKVRFLGEFPSASAAQLISSDDLKLGMKREVQSYYGQALLMAVDVARYGDNESVIAFRRGRDARTIPAQRFRGLSTVELAQQVAAMFRIHNPDALFVDGGGVGAGVVDALRSWGVPVIEVQFGSTAGIPLGGEVAGNKRAEMYLSFRTWLKEGGCIPDHPDVEKQFTAVQYYHSKAKHMKEAILLIPKEEMDEDQDWSDAIVMTFAFPVVAAAWRGNGVQKIKMDYNPLAPSALPNSGEVAYASGGISDNALYERILRDSYNGSVH